MARIVFFAQLREHIGISHTEIALPPQVNTVNKLLGFFSTLGEPYALIVNFPRLQIAVNQQYARADDPLSDHDEIAFFPSVSGG